LFFLAWRLAALTRFTLSAPPSADPAARRLSQIEQMMRSLRRGEIVVVRDDGDAVTGDWLAAAVDGIDGDIYESFAADPAARLVLAGPRAQALQLASAVGETNAVTLASVNGLDHLVLVVDPAIDGHREAAGLQIVAGQPVDDAVVELAKLAELLPAMLVRPAAQPGADAVPASDIRAYRQRVVRVLRRVSEAIVPLQNSERTRVVSFRPGDGGPDHLALIIGDPPPDQPVLVRLHSSCITGDLLGSLRCDCGDQLRGAIAEMSRQGAGVLLYLLQEGRGIGIANKLRAYTLQDSGFDTVDANDQLGFAADERSYAIAAEMLHQLGYTQVRLMTNNPEKLAALAEHGVSVVERVPHIFPPTEHSARYLAAKASRSGHLF